MKERIRLLREHVQALNDAGVRRTTFFPLVAESLKETVAQPPPIRRARAFAHLLERVEQAVLPHELLAGSILGMWPLAEGLPGPEERAREAAEVLERYRARKREAAGAGRPFHDRRWALMARDHYDANVDYADLQRLIGKMQERFAGADDLGDPEIGRELERHFNFDYGEETRRLFRELPWVAANHLDLNYGKVVGRGLGDIHREILERLEAADEPEKRTFYESARIALEAAIAFIRRYAGILLAVSERPGTDAARAQELREMAAVCRKVADGAPETFREALQLLWLVHVIANIGGGSALSFARFDQYMHPFYKKDLDDGTITREEAKALLSCMWLKVNEPHMRTVQSICLAGTTPAGEDAANELSALCLEVCGDTRQPYPNTAVRMHRGSPEWLWDQVIETIKLGIGQPQLLNDDAWIPNLVSVGFPLEDARDYYNMGCVEMMVMGRQPSGAAVHIPGWDWSRVEQRAGEPDAEEGETTVDFPAVIELVLNSGDANMAGQTGIPTGEPDSLQTFEQFLDAYCAQVVHRVRRAPVGALREDRQAAGRHFDPFGSALLDDCLERGMDMFQGGCKLPPIRRIGGFGLGTGTDSLSAIKKFVYDGKRLTLRQLKEVLEADFEGHEDLRAVLNGQTPCYGNDLDEADDIARLIFDAYADAVHANNDGSVPGPFVTSVFSYTRHVYAAEVIAATPNGRRARAPMSETIGPSQGRDVEGPTALINSVAGLDHGKITGAAAFNLKVSPGLVRGQAGSDALKALLKVYIRAGGVQIQVNFVDQEVLRDAQAHPDRHRDLIVRVAGYSEYFTSLDRELQDEIISRTSHGL